MRQVLQNAKAFLEPCGGLSGSRSRSYWCFVWKLSLLPPFPSSPHPNSHKIQNILILRIQYISPPPRLFRGFSQHIWSESGVVWSKWRKEALIFEEKWILSVVGVSLHFYILRVAKIMSFVTKRLVYIWYMCVLLKFTVEFPSVKNAEEKQNNQWECVAWVCNVCAPRVDVLTSLFEIWSHSRKSPQSSLLRTTWLNDLRTW